MVQCFDSEIPQVDIYLLENDDKCGQSFSAGMSSEEAVGIVARTCAGPGCLEQVPLGASVSTSVKWKVS